MERTDDADYRLLVVYARLRRVRVAVTGTSHHARIYAIGLVAASNKTVAGIEREVLPAQGKRALNKFLTEYDWDQQQLKNSFA